MSHKTTVSVSFSNTGSKGGNNMFSKLKRWFQKRWSKPKIVLIFPQKKKGTIEIPPYIPESYSSKSDVNLSKTSLSAFPPGKKRYN